MRNCPDDQQPIRKLCSETEIFNIECFVSIYVKLNFNQLTQVTVTELSVKISPFELSTTLHLPSIFASEAQKSSPS